MPFTLAPFADLGLDADLLRILLAEHAASTRPRLERLWRYYRNPAAWNAAAGDPLAGFRGAGRPRLAQEAGLPPRLTGSRRDPLSDDRSASRPEIVIENDIAWRLQTMVDFMFGRPVQIVSTAADPTLRVTIERTLDAAWEASGGIALLQDMALLGHVYGHVDLALRQAAPFLAADPAEAAAESLRIEAIEPTRGIAVLSASDYRQIDAYIIHFTRRLNRTDRPSALKRLLQPGLDPARAVSTVTEVLSVRWRQVYEQSDGEPRLIDSAPNALTPGVLPIVHIQNISQPFRYEGQGEVEPLIPLQDELNTRLSDRASRVTLQSFKMYLAKGLSGFEKGPVGPGQVWSTDNPDAGIEAFGGDAASPSEDAHIEQVREALDKTSAIPPLASGVVRARVGNLSSANALRITLMGTLSKTARKRVTYGRGIAEVSRLILHALDHAGILTTNPRDRGIRLVWADPIPDDTRDQLAQARAKRELGIDPARVLADLGHGPSDPGVM